MPFEHWLDIAGILLVYVKSSLNVNGKYYSLFVIKPKVFIMLYYYYNSNVTIIKHSCFIKKKSFTEVQEINNCEIVCEKNVTSKIVAK